MKNELIIEEKAILNTAITEFTDKFGATIKTLPLKPNLRELGMDTYWEIKFRIAVQRFYVEVKGELRQSNLNDLIYQFGDQRENWLLVARYIPGPLKTKMKEHGINYLEATGNCYINTGQIYLYVNDQPIKQVRRAPAGKLWNATGLKFLFVILQDPNLLSAPYREIARAAGIALGNISNLFDELGQGGYLEMTTTKEERLIHRDRLIERWVELFEVVLKPKLLKGRFRFLKKIEQKEWEWLDTEGIYWGGEPGADLYIDYLVPEKFTIYTGKAGNELVKQLRIAPDEQGNIIVLDKFWNDWPGYTKIKEAAAPPLLIYAELRNDLDSRNGEAAEKIKSKYLYGK